MRLEKERERNNLRRWRRWKKAKKDKECSPTQTLDPKSIGYRRNTPPYIRHGSRQ